MTIESQTAYVLAHRERTRKDHARTGGEAMHPDHYDLREKVRLAVLAALDEVADEAGIAKASDAELPALFRALDPIAERMFLASVGLIADRKFMTSVGFKD
jgi:hypothetical protein